MPQGLYVDAPEHTILKEYEETPLQDGQVRVQVEFAAIKHGTLFHLFSGKSPFQDRRFDPHLRMFVTAPGPQKPGGLVDRFTGDMVVGRVVETGRAATRFRVRDRVYCYGPVCETVTKTENDIHPLLPPLNELDAVCLDPALYAYTVLRDARVCLGDNVVLFGLGAIGLFVVQMLKLAGCLNVVAVDPMEKRRRLAGDRGADLVLDPTQCDVALQVRKFLGQGADIAIEASGVYSALHEAMRSVQPCARIATLGYYKGEATGLELAAEWHHNRLELIGSMPVWDNPPREFPIWDLARLQYTLEGMFAKKWLSSADIVDPVVDFPDAAQAFMDIYHNPSDAIKLGIRFPA